MEYTNTIIPVPGRLKSVASDNLLAGTNQIFDDDIEKFQSVINLELYNGLYFGEWDADYINPLTKNRGYSKNNKCSLYNCEFISLVDNNIVAPATLINDEIVVSSNWKLISGGNSSLPTPSENRFIIEVYSREDLYESSITLDEALLKYNSGIELILRNEGKMCYLNSIYYNPVSLKDNLLFLHIDLDYKLYEYTMTSSNTVFLEIQDILDYIGNFVTSDDVENIISEKGFVTQNDVNTTISNLKNIANGLAGLDNNGKLFSNVLPDRLNSLIIEITRNVDNTYSKNVNNYNIIESANKGMTVVAIFDNSYYYLESWLSGSVLFTKVLNYEDKLVAESFYFGYDNQSQGLRYQRILNDQDTDFIKTVKVNGSVITPDSNKAVNINLGSYAKKTDIPDISNLQEQLISGVNIATLNGQSLLEGKNIVIGGGGTFTQEQADWNETDSTSVKYIKNKPELSLFIVNVRDEEVEDLELIKIIQVADKTVSQIKQAIRLNQIPIVLYSTQDRTYIYTYSESIDPQFSEDGVRFNKISGNNVTYLNISNITEIDIETGLEITKQVIYFSSREFGENNIINEIKLNGTKINPVNKSVNVRVNDAYFINASYNSSIQKYITDKTYEDIYNAYTSGKICILHLDEESLYLTHFEYGDVAVFIGGLFDSSNSLERFIIDLHDRTDFESYDLAVKNSPVFTGEPKAPTPNATSNNTQIATTGWVIDRIGASGSGEMNIIEKVFVNGEQLPVSNKSVNITVPTQGVTRTELNNILTEYCKVYTVVVLRNSGNYVLTQGTLSEIISHYNNGYKIVLKEVITNTNANELPLTYISNNKAVFTLTDIGNSPNPYVFGFLITNETTVTELNKSLITQDEFFSLRAELMAEINRLKDNQVIYNYDSINQILNITDNNG